MRPPNRRAQDAQGARRRYHERRRKGRCAKCGKRRRKLHVVHGKTLTVCHLCYQQRRRTLRLRAAERKRQHLLERSAIRNAEHEAVQRQRIAAGLLPSTSGNARMPARAVPPVEI